jgi:hypothetical protein
VLELVADRVELVGTVDRHDADAAVDGVGHDLRGHGGSSARRAGGDERVEFDEDRRPEH